LPEVICDTSPLQYLFQIGHLDLLPALSPRVTVPASVIDELRVGRSMGHALPVPERLPWIDVRVPAGLSVLPLVTHLGPGERQVLALALESPGAVSLLDDALARKIAASLGLPIRGTLGVLLDAKRKGLIALVEPLINRLDASGFRLAARTRLASLSLAGE
jgi:uncharacterized protein